MILRRIIEHVRKQQWTAIGIDFVIVVAGVFVGTEVVLASIGDVDAAYADVENMLADCPPATTAQACIGDFPWRTLFYPMTASMRSDPRFMPLMRRAGLVAYWLETDRWPEFCDDPDLPYDCREEARRVSSAAPR